MSEKRNLVAYLPLFVAEYDEIKAALQSETAEFNRAIEYADKTLDNEFVTTADEKGLTRYEEMLGILPNDSDTIEDRRFRVMTRFTECVPYTYRVLATMLEALCGKSGYELTVEPQKYFIEVKVALLVKTQFDSVSKLIARILPCNIRLNVDLLYNTWEILGKYKWSKPKTLTWHDVKEEVIT